MRALDLVLLLELCIKGCEHCSKEERSETSPEGLKVVSEGDVSRWNKSQRIVSKHS